MRAMLALDCDAFDLIDDMDNAPSMDFTTDDMSHVASAQEMNAAHALDADTRAMYDSYESLLAFDELSEDDDAE